MKKTILFLLLMALFVVSCSDGKKKKTQEVVSDTAKMVENTDSIIQNALSKIDGADAKAVLSVLDQSDDAAQAKFFENTDFQSCNDEYCKLIPAYHDVSKEQDYIDFWKTNPAATTIKVSELIKLENGTSSCYSHWIGFTKDKSGKIMYALTPTFINNDSISSYSLPLFKGIYLNNNSKDIDLQFAHYNNTVVFKANELYNIRTIPK